VDTIAPMPEVAFVMSRDQPYALRELATTLQHELELQAVPSSLHLNGFPEPRLSLVYVLLDPGAYVAKEGDRALPADRILRRTIFLCTEPPPSAADREHIALLRRAGAVFVVDQPTVAAMHRLDITARLIRPGYSKSLDRFDSTASRSIDVMFVGTHSLRRTKYLSRAARVLSRHNCVLQICEDAPNALEIGSPLAAARWPLLSQAKVLISLHRDDQLRFDWRGAVDAIHVGTVVVTEPSSGIAPLVPGEHLVATSADSLPYIVEGLLRDERRLARLRSAAYERLRRWVPYALSVAILRAAVVELVGEPAPPQAALGNPRPAPAAADTAPPRAARELPPAIEPAWPAVKSIGVQHQSPAWASRRAPHVTAAVTLHGRDGEIVATLDSLAHSRLRDLELVVVDTGDSEQTRQTVRDWMSWHPWIPSRLVVASVTGVGAARNIGLDFARGAFFLILAPGQRLYPRCLDVLAGTLEALPEAAFAYPMEEVIGAPDDFVEAGGDYLLSYLGWDAVRLCARSDIHAPALIRTDSLRRLGGFATDPRLAGFEEYDLWCRMAERGWRGELVPQALARRSESGTSPTLSVPHP
jgi:Glycosyl transferase family 2